MHSSKKKLIVITGMVTMIILVIAISWRNIVLDKNNFNGVPSNSKMLYILFPKNKILSRAIFVNGEELYKDKAFQFFEGDLKKSIGRSDVSLYPPIKINDTMSYISKLNQELTRWGAQTDILKIEYSSDSNNVSVILFMKSGKKSIFRYRVKDDLIPVDCSIKIIR